MNSSNQMEFSRFLVLPDQMACPFSWGQAEGGSQIEKDMRHRNVQPAIVFSVRFIAYMLLTLRIRDKGLNPRA